MLLLLWIGDGIGGSKARIPKLTVGFKGHLRNLMPTLLLDE